MQTGWVHIHSIVMAGVVLSFLARTAMFIDTVDGQNKCVEPFGLHFIFRIDQVE